MGHARRGAHSSKNRDEWGSLSLVLHGWASLEVKNEG
jgi:hypothetical protein